MRLTIGGVGVESGGSGGSGGVGDVAGVWLSEPGVERLRDEGLDGRDDPGSELESSVPSGEPSGVEAAGRSSLAVSLLTNRPDLFRSRGTCCR